MRLFLVVAALAVIAPLVQQRKPGKIIVIAHRGANRFAPENTLPAFKKAIELGCDYVELDVRRTKDGELILMHDRTVDGKTNGHGAVEYMTVDELRALDAGIKRGPEWAGTKVPTFEEALAVCKGRIKVYVDNKAGPVDEVLAAIEKHKMLRQVVIYGGANELREFKKRRPNVWIMPGHPGSAEKITEMVRDLKPETMDGNLRSWTKEQVDAAHGAGVQVWVDNLGENDNEAGFQKALDMGVDGIQTDHPDVLVAFLKKVGRR